MVSNGTHQIYWSERVYSDSRVLDPLGIWGDHLKIQEDFTKGISSVTTRVRYYTLLAWYYQNRAQLEGVSYKNFERIFILSCLIHHNGVHKELYGVFNKTALDKIWDSLSIFNLDFHINGFLKIYYNHQLAVLKCAWLDYKIHTTSLNAKLANTIGKLDPSIFSEQRFTKDELKDLDNICICNSFDNEEEQETMSKLLFGFIKKNGNDWDFDDVAYQNFLKRHEIDLIFSGSNNLSDLDDETTINELNIRRRSTLFLVLNVIKNTKPEVKLFKRHIWDAIYFGQNHLTKENISFGRLEKARSYWEFFQLNVYYVYALEKILDFIQELVRLDSGINKNAIWKKIDQKKLFDILVEKLDHPISEKTTIQEFLRIVNDRTDSHKTTLDVSPNESEMYNLINQSWQEREPVCVGILMLLALIYKRYHQTSQYISDYNEKRADVKSPLNIHTLMFELSQTKKELTIIEFLHYLSNKIIIQHLYQSSLDLIRGTKNWIFTEEMGRLYSARLEEVLFRPRDNRWESILNLLQDMGFLLINNKIELTKKGLKWLDALEE